MTRTISSTTQAIARENINASPTFWGVLILRSLIIQRGRAMTSRVSEWPAIKYVPMPYSVYPRILPWYTGTGIRILQPLDTDMGNLLAKSETTLTAQLYSNLTTRPWLCSLQVSITYTHQPLCPQEMVSSCKMLTVICDCMCTSTSRKYAGDRHPEGQERES